MIDLVIEGKSIGTFSGKDAVKQRKLNSIVEPSAQSLRITLKKALKDLASESKKLEKALLDQIIKYAAKSITYKKLVKETKKLIKNSTEIAFRLGSRASGLDIEATKKEKKWITSYLREENKYWVKCLDDIVKGTSRQNILVRLRNYGRSLKSAFESARVLATDRNLTLVYWIKEKEPCKDCLFLFKHSPYTRESLPTTPGSGLTRCLSNCKCNLKFKTVSKEEFNIVKKRNKKPKWYIDRITKKLV